MAWWTAILVGVAGTGATVFALVLHFSYMYPRDGRGGYSLRSRLPIALHLFGAVTGLRRTGRSYATTRALYDTWQQHRYTEATQFINYGYWREARGLDDACRALAELVAARGSFAAAGSLLEIGYGYGDQDLLWAAAFPRLHITGLNIAPAQVAVARRRVAAAGLAARVRLGPGSATATGLPDASFERVAALECAFHFISRATFFAEAWRVLRPGGVLVTADIVAPSRPTPRDRLCLAYGHHQWQAPRANLCDSAAYVAQLTAQGFTAVALLDITEHVWPRLHAFMLARYRADPSRVPWPLRNAVSQYVYASSTCWLWPLLTMRYVVVTARRPGSGAG